MITADNCWVSVAENSDFSIYNIPFGIFSIENDQPRIGVAIGEQILDLSKASTLGIFTSLEFNPSVFSTTTLNAFIDLGKKITTNVRLIIQENLTSSDSVLKAHNEVFVNQSEAKMHLPVFVGDYTDFYSSIEHATNVGTMFRDPENALLPNWKHIPVGYHGRASSIIESGVHIYRPKGQTMPPDANNPVFGPSKRVDFELEMAYIIGKKTELGDSVSVEKAEDFIFGKVLFNDWSARDIQKWEYVPLGPFLAKSFASSISSWVVTMEALKPFCVASPTQNPEVLPYLQGKPDGNYNINLQVAIQPENGEETVISNSNFKYMYWSMAQQLAHHTINGCNINVGDMMGSGTISGPTKDSYGSMLELAWAGKKPISLKDGSTRTFINDNDTVIMRGYCEKGELRVGFGNLITKLLPTK